MSAQQSDMIALAIKDLYRLCHESGERQLIHTEQLVDEAFQAYNKKFESLLTIRAPFSSTSVGQSDKSANGSTYNVTRPVEPMSSSMSVTDIEGSVN